MQCDEAPVYAATKARLISASVTVQRAELVQFALTAVHNPTMPSLNFQDQIAYPPPDSLLMTNLVERFHHAFTSTLDAQPFVERMNDVRAIEDEMAAFELEEKMRADLEKAFSDKWDNFNVWAKKFVNKLKRRLCANSNSADERHHHSDLSNKWDKFISGKQSFRTIDWRIKADEMVRLFKNMEEQWFNILLSPPGLAEWILLPLPSVESAFRHSSMRPFSRQINSWKHAFFCRQYENLSRIPTTVQHHMAKRSSNDFHKRVLRMATLKRLSLSLRPAAKLVGATFYRRRPAIRGSEQYLRYARYDDNQERTSRSANLCRLAKLPTNQQRFNRRQRELNQYNHKKILYRTQRLRRFRRYSLQRAIRVLANLARQRNQDWRSLKEEAEFAGTAILFDN